MREWMRRRLFSETKLTSKPGRKKEAFRWERLFCFLEAGYPLSPRSGFSFCGSNPSIVWLSTLITGTARNPIASNSSRALRSSETLRSVNWTPLRERNSFA